MIFVLAVGLPVCSVHHSVHCLPNSFDAVLPDLFNGTVPLGDVKYCAESVSEPKISAVLFFFNKISGSYRGWKRTLGF